ncbi:MAG: monovalent cation/H(+) antiporter subunit G [Cucumibacter sp.]
MIAELHLYLVGTILVIGAIFSCLAAVGILRLPDLYTRMHAASKAGTLGSGLTLIAIAIFALDAGVALRALAGVAFLLLTAPVAAHLLARSAYIAGYKPAAITRINDLDPDRKSNSD